MAYSKQLTVTTAFADGAHAGAGQLRKYTNDPYIVHPIEVMQLLEGAEGPVTDVMRAAALLHDVVEDTAVTLENIKTRFGVAVMALVRDLTDVARPEDGSRAVRVAVNRDHLARASSQAKTIKLADLISNTKSIVQHDPNFAAVYLPEKRALLEVLHEGDRRLFEYAERLVNEGFEKLQRMKESA